MTMMAKMRKLPTPTVIPTLVPSPPVQATNYVRTALHSIIVQSVVKQSFIGLDLIHCIVSRRPANVSILPTSLTVEHILVAGPNLSNIPVITYVIASALRNNSGNVDNRNTIDFTKETYFTINFSVCYFALFSSCITLLHIYLLYNLSLP